MGYYITQGETEILIKAEHHMAIVQKIKEFVYGGNHFDWTNDNTILNTFSVEIIFSEVGWNPQYDEQGDIIGLEFVCEKLGSEDVFFELIAEFVEDGSYITIHGECEDSWRYVFNNGKMQILQGRIIYE